MLKALVLGGVVSVVLASGCGDSCPKESSEEHHVFDGGTVEGNGAFYYSSRIDEKRLPFPAGRTYEFIHHLNGVPQQPQVYLSFSERGGTEAEAAGNLALIGAGKTPERSFTVRNDTCEDDFYVRVVATAVLGASDGDDEAAGAAGASAEE